MAIGDIVSGVSVGLTDLYFQPAAGVEIMILTMNSYDAEIFLYNGVQAPSSLFHSATSGNSTNAVNCKVGLNNSIYIKLNAASAGGGSCYSGIQIK